MAVWVMPRRFLVVIEVALFLSLVLRFSVSLLVVSGQSLIHPVVSPSQFYFALCFPCNLSRLLACVGCAFRIKYVWQCMSNPFTAFAKD